MSLHMTEQEYLDWEIAQGRIQPGNKKVPKARAKYGNKYTVVDGIKFQSIKEANRYTELKLLQREGTVLNFIMQVPFLLPGGVKYFLDFMVWWADGRISYEDTKGVRTDVFIIKKKQVEDLFPIKIEEN